MRIPTYDSPQVAPEIRATPRVQNIAAEETASALSQGASVVGQLGEGLEQYQRGLELTRQKAIVADASGGVASWQNEALDVEHGTADGQPGYYSLQGEDALAQSAPTVDQLEKKRQEVANTLKTSEARSLFLHQTGELMLAHRRGIEDYAHRQFQAAQDQRADAMQATAVRTAASSYADDDAASTAVDAASRAIAASMHGQPPEAIQARLDKLKQDTATARIQAALGQQDADTAGKLLEAHRKELGAEAPQIERQVGALRDALASDTQTKDIIQGSMLKGYPWVDEAAALAKVDALPAGKKKDETQARVEHQLLLNQRLKEQAGKYHLNQLQAFYAQSGDPADPRMAPVRAWMKDPNNGAADLLEKFDRGVAIEERSQRSSDAEARREQAMADRDAFETYMAHPIEDRVGLDVEREYLGTASKLGRDRIRAQQQRDASTVQRGQQEGEVEFYRDVRTQAQQAHLDNGGPVDKQPRLQKLIGFMNSWRAQYLLDNSKPPTRQEVRQQLAQAFQMGDPGFWHADKYRFEYGPGETFQPAPADKQTSPLATSSAAPAGPAARSPAAPTPTAGDETGGSALAAKVHAMRTGASIGRSAVVVERRVARDGRVLEKLSDGSIRVANGE